MDKKETKDITKKILLALAIGSFLTLAMVAPGIVIAAKPFLEWQKYDKRRFRAALKRMRRQRLIELKELPNGETAVKITKEGEQKVLKYKFHDIQIPKPKKWDKIWRIVIFDIPNTKRRSREALREKLRELGFCKIQKSVFVHPYECENEIEFIKAIFNIQSFVLIIKAQKIDREEILKQHFDLL